MANYVISKVKVSKPSVEGLEGKALATAKNGIDEAFENVCNEISSDPSGVWEEINEEAQCWDGIAPNCWIDEDSGFRTENDSFIFNVISEDNFPLAHLFEIFRDRYYPLCIDVAFADEIADYEIDYSECDYGNGFEEVSETNDVLNNTGCVGIMRLRQNINLDDSDEDETCYDMQWKFFFPKNEDEKNNIKNTAWAGCTFSDEINANSDIVEGEDDVMALDELLKQYTLAL